MSSSIDAGGSLIMTKTTPFNFDRSFDRDTNQSATPRGAHRRTLTLDEIEALKREAHAAGTKAADAGHAKRAADGIERLVMQVAALLEALDRALTVSEAEAVTLAHAIGTRLARTLIAAEPTREIEALIARTLDEHKSEPAIVLRLNDQLVDPVKAAARKIAEERGFNGRLLVIGEPQIAVGDCTIEWADGGLERDFDGTMRRIGAALASYLEAKTNSASAMGNTIRRVEPPAMPDSEPNGQLGAQPVPAQGA